MGNSCKGTLATSKRGMELLNPTETLLQTSVTYDRGVAIVNVSQSCGLIKYPANVIQVEIKPCESSNLARDSSDETEPITPIHDQSALSMRTGSCPDQELLNVTSRRSLEEALTLTQIDANTQESGAGNTKPPSNNPDHTDHMSTNEESPMKEEPTEVTCGTGSKSPVQNELSSRSSLSEVIQREEIFQEEFISRSHSFESIETLSLKDGQSKDHLISDDGIDLHCGVTDSKAVEKNIKPLPRTYIDNKLKNSNKLSSNITLSHVNASDSSATVLVEDPSLPSQNSSSAEAPRALVNLLHSLYYGKRSKYRGCSNFRGKGPVPGSSLLSMSKRFRDDNVLMLDNPEVKLNRHGLVPLVGHVNTCIVSPTMPVKSQEEGSGVTYDTKTTDSPGEEKKLSKESQDRDDQSSLDLQTHKEYESPTTRFPFNLYKERTQSVSQSSFPLADYRFDDGIYPNETSPPKLRSPTGKNSFDPNTMEHKQTEKSLASALSVAGHIVKGFSMSQATLSKALPIGLNLDFQAGASLNEVFINVSSSCRLCKNNNPKRRNSESHNTQYRKPPELAKMVNTTCIQSDMNGLTSTEHKRHNQTPESIENLLKAFDRNDRTLCHNRLLKTPFSIDNTSIVGTHGLSTTSLQNCPPHRLLTSISPPTSTLNTHGRCSLLPVPKYPPGHSEGEKNPRKFHKEIYFQSTTSEKGEIYSSKTYHGYRSDSSTHWDMIDPLVARPFHSYFQKTRILNVPVLKENLGLTRLAISASHCPGSDSSSAGHSLFVVGRDNRNSSSGKLVYSRHMNKLN
ncbi:hypothetical protein ElyMa_000121100 [Elysia marginata]|uniref:DUF4210 domain-containing protein n=1 Tax=Elysia marginata TaxID=1093978 RepID=A0AAV4EPC7_9GAST|nr:hypothetical protein ElyMa_000121100 [Elysia marginata]